MGNGLKKVAKICGGITVKSGDKTVKFDEDGNQIDAIIIVFDLEGSGYSPMYTTDGKTWLRASKTLMNKYECDKYVERWKFEMPGARVMEVKDFYARIPSNLLKPDTRVL